MGDLRRGQRGGLVVGAIVRAPVAAVSLGVCHKKLIQGTRKAHQLVK